MPAALVATACIFTAILGQFMPWLLCDGDEWWAPAIGLGLPARGLGNMSRVHILGDVIAMLVLLDYESTHGVILLASLVKVLVSVIFLLQLCSVMFGPGCYLAFGFYVYAGVVATAAMSLAWSLHRKIQ